MRIELIQGKPKIDPERLLEFSRKLQDKYQVAIQIFDSAKILDQDQLVFAAQKALRAFQAKTNISKSLQTEILLYAAGTRQISKAIKLGINPQSSHVTIVGVGGNISEAFEELKSHLEESSPPQDPSKLRWIMEFYGITPQELEIVGEGRIKELVLERMALLELFK